MKSEKSVEEIVDTVFNKISANLSDRRGLKNYWGYSLDDDIREEIEKQIEKQIKGYILEALTQTLQAERQKREEVVETTRKELIDTVRTVFSIYIAVFPTPRDTEQRVAQDVIKNSIRSLKENLLEALTQPNNK